jgi:branched-chain amino acid transport system substrate-binding protein
MTARGRLLTLAAACCLAASFLAAGAARAAISDDEVKIGVLADMSSPRAALSGPGAVVAAKMAAADFGGAASKTVTVIAGDHLGKPDVGAAIARQWFDQDHVDAIADASGSDVALAVQQVARERGKLALFAGPATPDLTGKDCSPTGIAWTPDGASLARGAAAALAKEGAESWFFLTSAGDGAAAEQRAVTAAGATVLGTAPFADGDAALRKAAASKAAIVALAGDALAAALPADWLGKGQRLLAFDVGNLKLQNVQRLLVVSPFLSTRTDETRRWSKRFTADSKEIPTMVQAGIYTAVAHYLKAVAAAGTDDGAAVAAKMRALPIDDVMTQNGRLRADGSVARDLYLLQVESKDPGDDLKQLAVIPAAASFPAVSGDCPLVNKGEGATQ